MLSIIEKVYSIIYKRKEELRKYKKNSNKIWEENKYRSMKVRKVKYNKKNFRKRKLLEKYIVKIL